jgi:hypothetical protein
MLTIKDLSASKELDRAAMTAVRGGTTEELTVMPEAGFIVANAPIIDAGAHFLAQGQAAVIGQGGNLGGFNAVANWQYQNGVSGQVVS